MNEMFQNWIAENYPTAESAHLKCAEATLAMVEVFPQLKRERGYVLVGLMHRPHWWCLTPDNIVVDPTVHQWPEVVTIYEPLETNEEPHGKCFHCGTLLFRSQGAESYFCQECIH